MSTKNRVGLPKYRALAAATLGLLVGVLILGLALSEDEQRVAMAVPTAIDPTCPSSTTEAAPNRAPSPQISRPSQSVEEGRKRAEEARAKGIVTVNAMPTVDRRCMDTGPTETTVGKNAERIVPAMPESNDESPTSQSSPTTTRVRP
jgi:hypothetical protein